jgi:hypothetical protein
MKAVVVLLLMEGQAAWGQTPPQTHSQGSSADLTQVSLENLMNMEVTSVSKKEQKLSGAGAAIFVGRQQPAYLLHDRGGSVSRVVGRRA